jgi:uncharacterized membrane protein
MIVSALLMIAGGVLAAVGIENPRENDVDAAALPAAASA